MSQPAASASGGGTGGGGRDFKDNVVPKFDNQTTSYREWRKRVLLYARKLQLQGRANEAALNVLAMLDGPSWTQCEDLDLKELEKEDGLDILLRRLDASWSFDSRVEMPVAFEGFFFRLRRKQNQTLLEYAAEFHQSLREVAKHKIDIPEEVSGWMMLKRAGLTREQEQLIYTQVGTSLTLGSVEKALYLVLGQDYRTLHLPGHIRRSQQQQPGRWKKQQMTHHAWDEVEWDENEDWGFNEWDDEQEDPDETEWIEEPNADATFYEASETATVDGESVFDTEEFDMTYASYVDAKNKLNQLRQARGFFPVVALTDGGKGGQLPVMAQSSAPSSPHRGKGKAGQQKGKQNQFKGSRPKGKGPTVKARAKTVLGEKCLRCGRWDHTAANCPSGKPGSSSSPSKRRVIDLDGDPMINMALHDEVCQHDKVCQQHEGGPDSEFHEVEDAYVQGESLVRAGGWLTKEPDTCIQDQGASSFLIGSEYALRYLKWLEVNGYPMEQISFKRCEKGFKFGGDASGVARWMVELPVHISGMAGRLQAYVIFGATPMLLGRPILEKLNVDISFGSSRMRIMQGAWQDILRGKQDAMLLRLAGDVKSVEEFADPQFDLRCEDDHNGGLSLDEFLSDLRAQERYGEMLQEVQPYQFALMSWEDEFLAVDTAEQRDLDEAYVLSGIPCKEVKEKTQEQMEKTWRWMQYQAVESDKQASAVMLAARQHRPPHRRLIWEVYAGEGMVSKILEEAGDVKVMRFGLQDGWDFSKNSHRKQLLRLCDELEPDEIFMSPKCTLWSRMQNINMQTDDYIEDLELRRDVDHDTHLRLCRKLYMKQVHRGAHAHIEHPRGSLAWETAAWRSLPGYKALFDQCMYGSTALDDHGHPQPIMKPTRIQTTKLAMYHRMSLHCDGSHSHQRLEGKARCRTAENYQEQLARNLAWAILQIEGVEEQTFAVGDQDAETEQLTGVLRRLGTRHGHEAVRLAYRLHRNLGHPRREVLLKMLEGKQCSSQVIDAVRDLECPYCAKHAVKKSSAPAHADRAQNFNDQVQADVLWLDLEGQSGSRAKKVPVVCIVDTATRYMAARTVPDETGASLQKAFEREWVRYFGPPKQLFVDEGTGWASDATGLWAEENGIDLRISPGQSHTRTSVVERRHQILRKAISVFMLENKLTGLDGVHSALNWVLQAINGHTFVNGFTPTQLALGREPSLPGLLSDERTGPLQLQMTEQERLHKKLQLKFSAQYACSKAEVDVKLRRALLRRYTGRDEELHPGERCLYWREANNKFHTVQWRGPAVVVGVQRDPDTGTVDVYWIAHNTVLLRAGRQHVRRVPDAEGRLDCGARAQSALDGLRQRRVVRIIDLNKTNKRSLDELDPETDDYSPSLLPDPNAGPSAVGGPPLGSGDGVEDQLDGLFPDEVQDEPTNEVENPDVEVEMSPQPEMLPDIPDLREDDLRQISVDEPMSEPSEAHQREPQTSPTHEPQEPQELPPVPEDNDLQEPTTTTAQASSSAGVTIDPSFVPVPGESFAERRKRFDMQETIFPRLRAPEQRRLHEPLSKKARTEEDLSLEIFGFDFSQTPLPEGWHYDQQTNEFFLSEVQDYWSYEDGFLVRNHVVGRTETFNPEEFPLQSMHGLTMQKGSRQIYAN